MKKLVIVAVVAFAMSAHADDKKPSKMSREDMLDAELTQMKIAEADRAKADLVRHLDEIGAKYALSPQDRVAPDGTIQRDPPKAPAKK